MYRGRGGGDHPGAVVAQVQLRVPRLVNVGPGARLDLERRNILLDWGSIGSSPGNIIGPSRYLDRF